MLVLALMESIKMSAWTARSVSHVLQSAGEANGVATGRAKLVRPEFVVEVKQSEHWQHQAMVPNQLAAKAEIWA